MKPKSGKSNRERGWYDQSKTKKKKVLLIGGMDVSTLYRTGNKENNK